MAAILVIDDDARIRDAVRMVLEDAGHGVVCTDDGNEVGKLFANRSFDLVITDIAMPQRDGIEVIRELKEKWPAVGIIATSGANPPRDELYLSASKALGADVVLGKPFASKRLLECVDEALKASQLRKSGR